MRTIPAIAPLTDISVWVRGNGLEVVLLLIGTVLLVRFVGWARDKTTERIETTSKDADALVRSEASKHRHALAQILTWVLTILLWTVTLALVLNRFGVPFASLVAPLTAGGVALGLGAQRLVQDLIGGSFIIAERQYRRRRHGPHLRDHHDRRRDGDRPGSQPAHHPPAHAQR